MGVNHARAVRVAAAWLAVAAPSLWGQAYTFTKVAANFFDQRPDGQGSFNIAGGPAIEGNTVYFVAFGQRGFNDATWAAPVGSAPQKLLDPTASAPGGTGRFTNLTAGGSTSGSLRVRNGLLLFFASDSVSSASNGGLFTMPASGGAVSRVMNYRTPHPAGGVFYTQIDNNGFGDFVSYISPNQVNAQAPADNTVGPVTIRVTASSGASNGFNIQKAALAPGMLAPAAFNVGGQAVSGRALPGRGYVCRKPWSGIGRRVSPG